MMMMTASLFPMATSQRMRVVWRKKYGLFWIIFCFTPNFLFAIQDTNDSHSTSQDGGDLEKLKLRQKLKAREWDELMSTKKKMKVLEPVVKGCVWEEHVAGVQLFQPYSVCLIDPLPKADSSPSQEDASHRGQREEQRKSSQLKNSLESIINSGFLVCCSAKPN